MQKKNELAQYDAGNEGKAQVTKYKTEESETLLLLPSCGFPGVRTTDDCANWKQEPEQPEQRIDILMTSWEKGQDTCFHYQIAPQRARKTDTTLRIPEIILILAT
jgi:hypothetical protein